MSDEYLDAAETVAREHWCTDDLQIDDMLEAADFSQAENGCWVRAWVWVSNELIETILPTPEE